jgi:hypothetical protein
VEVAVVWLEADRMVVDPLTFVVSIVAVSTMAAISVFAPA